MCTIIFSNFVGLKRSENMDELREIIYCERTDLDDFLLEHQLWEDMYDDFFLDMFNMLEEDILFTPNILTTLNDIYFGCIKVLLDPHPEISFRTRYLKKILPYNPEYSHESILVVSIMYAVFSLTKYKNRKNVRWFLKTAEKILSYSHFFKSAKNFVQNSKTDYNYTLKFTPISPDTLDYLYGPDLPQKWLKLINCFVNKNGKYYNILDFRKILSLYATKEDKLKILKQIRLATCLEFDPDELDSLFSTLRTEIEEMPDAEEACVPAEPVKHSASKKPKEGRAKDYLFKKNQTEALAKEFLLELRNKGFEDFNGRKSPAPKKRCEIYRALMKFIRNHNGSVEVKSGASICRFLTASCGILLPKEGNNNSNYETEIRKILNE